MIKPKEMQQFPTGEAGFVWEDGHESVFLPEFLRKKCPCALCSHDPVRGEGFHPLKFKIRRLRPVGNYAVGIEWADGHDTGIYAYDYLRGLCMCDQCKKQVGP
jgi:DUF971 family protein